jgi:hypothetical protein
MLEDWGGVARNEKSGSTLEVISDAAKNDPMSCLRNSELLATDNVVFRITLDKSATLAEGDDAIAKRSSVGAG